MSADSSVLDPNVGRLLILAGLSALALYGCKRADPEPTWLSDRGRLVVLGDAVPQKTRGTTFARVTEPIQNALEQNDAAALVRLLDAAKVSGLLLSDRSLEPAPPTDLAGRLAASEWITGLRAVQLSERASLFAVDRAEPIDRATARRVLAPAARKILKGVPAPDLAAFPESLRTRRQCEILILLRERGRPLLWRSARATTVARAFTLAAQAARQRWTERLASSAGALSTRLDGLDVEVWSLIDDGTLKVSHPAALTGLLTSAHGVGFEQPGRWRYVLPEQLAVQSPQRALARLFADNDLDEDSLSRPDVRVYRFVSRQLSADRAKRDQLSATKASSAEDKPSASVSASD